MILEKNYVILIIANRITFNNDLNLETNFK